MTETIEGEVIEELGQALEEAAPALPTTLLGGSSPAAAIGHAQAVARSLADVIEKQKLFVKIGPKRHVLYEGWTLLGSLLGVFPVVEWTRPIEGGWEARVVAKTLTGAEVGAAEAMCVRSEKRWASADDYAIRSMAQTRAGSKALRLPLGFVMQLAGYEATPAEEMGGGGSEPKEEIKRENDPLPVPRSWAKVTEYVAAYPDKEGAIVDLFFHFADSARRLLYPGSTDTAQLAKEEKAELLKIAGGAAKALRDAVPASGFPPPGEVEIRAAFASVLEGQELEPAPPKEPEAPDPETFE